MAALTSVSEVTSHLAKPALAPSAVAAAWPGPSCTSNKVTRPPAATMWRATALPRPEAPPVTTARASAIFIGIPCWFKSAHSITNARPALTALSGHLDRNGRGLAAADT